MCRGCGSKDAAGRSPPPASAEASAPVGPTASESRRTAVRHPQRPAFRYDSEPQCPDPAGTARPERGPGGRTHLVRSDAGAATAGRDAPERDQPRRVGVDDESRSGAGPGDAAAEARHPGVRRAEAACGGDAATGLVHRVATPPATVAASTHGPPLWPGPRRADGALRRMVACVTVGPRARRGPMTGAGNRRLTATASAHNPASAYPHAAGRDRQTLTSS